MPLYLEIKHRKELKQFAIKSYPNECCGFLLGKYDPEGKKKVVTHLLHVRNQTTESPKNRFLISPLDALQAEKEARKRGLDIVGYYHSHPDQPAEPSQTDLDHAPLPGYSIIIINSHKKGTSDINSWVLRDDRSGMDREEIVMV